MPIRIEHLRSDGTVHDQSEMQDTEWTARTVHSVESMSRTVGYRLIDSLRRLIKRTPTSVRVESVRQPDHAIVRVQRRYGIIRGPKWEHILHEGRPSVNSKLGDGPDIRVKYEKSKQR